MIKAILKTDHHLAPTIARLTVGLVMLPHGLQKTFGLFGGYGFSGTMGYFTGSVGLPWLIAFLVIVIESLGALGLIAGLLSRVAALGTIAVMLGAIFTSHLANGFFMNWFGNQQGEGIEFHLLVIGLSLIVLICGSGRFSLDRAVGESS